MNDMLYIQVQPWLYQWPAAWLNSPQVRLRQSCFSQRTIHHSGHTLLQRLHLSQTSIIWPGHDNTLFDSFHNIDVIDLL